MRPTGVFSLTGGDERPFMEGMSDAAVQSETTPRFQPPVNVQFSVFLDMRVGKMLELLEVFNGHALCVAAISVVDATDHAVVRVLTSRSELARRLLQRHDLPYSEVDVLVCELPGEGNLHKMCQTLLGCELNIHYIYPLLVSPRGHPAVAVHTDDNVFAGNILRKKLFTLLGENDLGENRTGSDPLDDEPG
jgi:hypothetical protein